MADDTGTPAALPFWKSPVFILIATAFLTRLVAAFPGAVSWVGLSDSSINVFVTGISLAVGGLADLIALRLRVKSKLQPLTVTQGAADEITATNPTPVEVKK